jgi:hypothetical protein
MDQEQQDFEAVLRQLSPQKKKVLERLLAHKSYPIICTELNISDSTLRKHISAIYGEFTPFWTTATSDSPRRHSQSDLLALFAKFGYGTENLNARNSAPDPSRSEVSFPSPYIPHQSEEALARQILAEKGALLRIQAPPKMGKTQFISRLITDFHQQEHTQAIYINFLETEKSDLQDLELLLEWFCLCIIGQIAIPEGSNTRESLGESFVKRWKTRKLSTKIKCSDWFEDVLLNQAENLILFVDDVDLLYKEENNHVAGDFLTMLRAWHDKAKSNSLWQKLKIVLTYSLEYTEVNKYESPFNVGIGIKLPPLDKQQVQEFVRGYRLDCSEAQIDLLMDWLGGHPYLIKITLIYIINSPTTLEEIFERAIEENSIYTEHLRYQLRLLTLAIGLELEPYSNPEKQEKAVTFLQEITSLSNPQKLKRNFDSHIVTTLKDMGLIKLEDNQLAVINCRLYQKYFSQYLPELS